MAMPSVVSTLFSWARERIQFNVLFVVLKFIYEFQPHIFETVNKNVKVLKCANDLFVVI